jgi:ketosteroid isomerase-like protein
MTGIWAILILWLSAAVPICAQASREKGLESLAEAERAFSDYTVKHGFRDGFIKFFADDGIGFGPHPERTKEALQKQPAQTGPRTLIFEWAPMFGDVSAAGDMGYTTGPVLYTDVSENPRPPRHGIYFSVWQKQADGAWKVVIDMGVNTPQAVAPMDVAFKPAAPVTDMVKRVPTGDKYRELDRGLSNVIFRTSPAKAYRSSLSKEFRFHRNGLIPITEMTFLDPVLAQASFEFIDGKISRSNDLAFTYGKYDVVNDPKNDETGYYVHVWRREGSGEWKLVADVQNPLPKSVK